jgi:phosphatidylglycerophosphate synthase
MLDARLRPLIDPPLNAGARRAMALGLSANAMTGIGFAIGLLALAALGRGHYGLGLLLILMNRTCDGLDGAIARRVGVSELGGFLDIVADFLFYALVPLGFALADPAHARAAAVLIVSFVATGSTFLAFAVIAGGRGLTSAARGRKSFYHLGGLAEGSETILAFVLFCLFPSAFPTLAYLFAALCALTALGRVRAAFVLFSGD